MNLLISRCVFIQTDIVDSRRVKLDSHMSRVDYIVVM